MTTSGLVPQSWLGITGQQVAVCALIYFYVHGEPLNDVGPLLIRLLSYTTRLIFQVDAMSPSLTHFIQLLSTALHPAYKTVDAEEKEEISAWISKIESIIQESTSFSGLHNFFTKVERLLMTEELYDELRNVTIKPAERQIDEQSPLGLYLQRCLDNYLGLEDDDFSSIVSDVQRWVAGEGTRAEQRNEDIDTSDYAVSLALQKGDYSLARSELEGFFDRSPLDSSNLSLEDTLFKNALFHYRTKAYESAKASLDEALRLSRGVNNLSCISACDSLLRRIEHEEDSVQLRISNNQTPFTLQDLWQVQRELDGGKPLLSVLASLSDLLRPGKGKMKGQELHQFASSEEFAECCLYQARIWADVGIEVNRSSFLNACMTEGGLLDSVGSVKLDLPIASLQSDALIEAGKVNESIATLFDGSLLRSLSMATFGEWQAKVWRVLYRSALEAGSGEIKSAIRAVRPEVVQEVEGKSETACRVKRPLEALNEASFDRSDKSTLSQQLLGKLTEAQTLREEGNDCAVSLIMSAQIMKEAEESNLFRLYRLATLECSESLLGLGNSTRAREVLEGVLPQLLVETRASLRGKSNWLQARILLSLYKQGETGLQTVLPWLERAREAFNESGTKKDLSDVLFVQARLFDHLGMQQEAQDSRSRFQVIMQESTGKSQEELARLFESVRTMVMLVGARVVAGA